MQLESNPGVGDCFFLLEVALDKIGEYSADRGKMETCIWMLTWAWWMHAAEE